MAKMINLKAEAGEGYEPMPVEQYGYGLRLYLDCEACEKLGLGKALKPGTRVAISASALVVSSSEQLDADGDAPGNEVTLSLQITDLGLTPQGVERNAAAVLYGG